MRSLRPSAVLTALACLALPALARAQFLTSGVTGASLRGTYFQATWGPGPSHSWSALQGHLVHVYRATIDDGTITLGATLAANSAPRVAQGPSSSQTLYLRHVAGTVAADSDLGNPSTALSVQFSVPWDKAPTIFSYPLFLAYDVEVANMSATCNGTPCFVKHTIVVLPARAAIAIGGTERSVPTIVGRQQTHFDLASAGISPFAEWESIALDGVDMTKIPFMAGYAIPPALNWYRHPVRPGDATQSGDPLPPTGVVPNSTNESIEKFLSCGAAGCGTHQARIGLGQGTLPTGLHTLRLRTRPYAGAVYNFYGTQANVGGGIADDTSELTTQFIVFGPQMQLATTEAGPGQELSVTGSGWAPNSTVRLIARISSVSRTIDLGTADTDVTGSFDVHPTLPPTSDPFFTEVVGEGVARGGSLTVEIEDAQFEADYPGVGPTSASVQMTFLPIATATTTTTLVGGTTTTTLPGGGDPGIDDTPSCAAAPMPAKAVEKYDAADGGMDIVTQMIAEAAARKTIRKAIGKVDVALGGARRLVNRARKKGLIPESCAVEAFQLIDDLRQQAKDARKSLKGLF